MSAEDVLDIALASVRNAIEFIATIEASGQFTPLSKSDKSPVTSADLASQLGICHHLLKACPNVPVISEEESGTLTSSAFAPLLEGFMSVLTPLLGIKGVEAYGQLLDHGRDESKACGQAWVIDPIDGTKGYLRGDQYAIALGYLRDGVPEVGVLACPRLSHDSGTGALIFGIRGKGAWLTPMDDSSASIELKVKPCNDLASWNYCESVEAGHTSHDEARAIADAIGITKPSLRMDSQCKYAAVAMGMTSYYLRFPRTPGRSEKIWDHVAGHVIVEAAGGKVTDVDGKPLDYSKGSELTENRGMIVSQGGDLHARIQDTVRGLGL